MSAASGDINQTGLVPRNHLAKVPQHSCKKPDRAKPAKMKKLKTKTTEMSTAKTYDATSITSAPKFDRASLGNSFTYKPIMQTRLQNIEPYF